MAILTAVDDPDDPRIDDYRDLTTADRRPDRPGGRGLVIAEGVVVVRRLLDSPYPVRSLLGVPRRLEELSGDLARLDVPAYATDADTMARAVGFHLNRGVLAVADRAAAPDLAGLLARARSVAVCEGVGDHENLGSLFRNAAALGVDLGGPLVYAGRREDRPRLGAGPRPGPADIARARRLVDRVERVLVVTGVALWVSNRGRASTRRPR